MIWMLYLAWSIAHWLASPSLIKQHFLFRQQSGAYPPDGDSISIPIYYIIALQILLSPIYIFITWYAVKSLRHKTMGKSLQQLLVVIPLFCCVNVYFSLTGFLFKPTLLSAYHELWSLWLITSFLILVQGFRRSKRSQRTTPTVVTDVTDVNAQQ